MLGVLKKHGDYLKLSQKLKNNCFLSRKPSEPVFMVIIVLKGKYQKGILA